jgi:hypothetical protein
MDAGELLQILARRSERKRLGEEEEMNIHVRAMFASSHSWSSSRTRSKSWRTGSQNYPRAHMLRRFSDRSDSWSTSCEKSRKEPLWLIGHLWSADIYISSIKEDGQALLLRIPSDMINVAMAEGAR